MCRYEGYTIFCAPGRVHSLLKYRRSKVHVCHVLMCQEGRARGREIRNSKRAPAETHAQTDLPTSLRFVGRDRPRIMAV